MSSPASSASVLSSLMSTPSSSNSADNQSIHSMTSSSIREASNYTVASHSVRITKHGYAIQPVELRYQEILTSTSKYFRKSSDAAFDSSQVGHKILKLIRGFWSQPAFPKGIVAKRKDKNDTLEAILKEFNRIPIYPHKDTYGSMAAEKMTKNSSKIRISSKKVKVDSSNSPVRSPTNSLNGNQDSASITSTKETTLMMPSITLPLVKSSPSNKTVSKKKKTPSSPDSSSLLSLFSPKRSRHKPDHSIHHVTSHYHTWIPSDQNQISDLVSNLCQQMEKIFSNEARIIEIPTPCIVLGDIHGNLTDLRTYERSLWPKAPVSVTSNYLFLGDYVDRGEYSVECVLYLFAMKLISPNRFFLLRGNHEVAAIQKQYTFGRECEAKFGSFGKNLWKSFNRVFNVMPIAAILDGRIFCAHGGIPRAVTDVRYLAKQIPTPLDNPEIQSPAAWEILWNDPITDSELIGMIELDNAVVTQTQITQTSPSPDGTGLVTTTTSTTALSSEASKEVVSPSAAQVDKKLERPPPSTGTITNTSTEIPVTTSSKQQERALDEVESILNREPPEATSFYIKQPTDQLQDEVNSDVGLAGASKQKSDDGTNLRTVPSDTSSIASTSPQQMFNDGFVSNIKRGTAFLFSDQAVNHFLKVNRLSHVIRAHEVIPTGFAFHGNGRVITIFSSSKYCGLNNQAACCLVDQQRIRILRLDTGDAGE